MKTISLWQPWASLIATGAKKIETRSWPTNYRGPLAIHAAKYMPKPYQLEMGIEAFNRIHNALLTCYPHGYNRDFLPKGEVIVTCILRDCLKVTGEIGCPGHKSPILENGLVITGNEFYFGDYTTGRYAWILEDIQPLPEPIPAKGMQGLWNWEV